MLQNAFAAHYTRTINKWHALPSFRGSVHLFSIHATIELKRVCLYIWVYFGTSFCEVVGILHSRLVVSFFLSNIKTDEHGEFFITRRLYFAKRFIVLLTPKLLLPYTSSLDRIPLWCETLGRYTTHVEYSVKNGSGVDSKHGVFSCAKLYAKHRNEWIFVSCRYDVYELMMLFRGKGRVSWRAVQPKTNLWRQGCCAEFGECRCV